MKMIDYFDYVKAVDITTGLNDTEFSVVDGDGIIGTKERAKAAAHAINCHDGLVDALERVVKWNELSVETRVDIGSNGERDYYRAIVEEALDQAKGAG